MGEFVNLIDYKMEDILRMVWISGNDFKVFSNKMSLYWHKDLDFHHGFCYTFDPSAHGDIKLSTDAQNMALLLLDVSTILYYTAMPLRNCTLSK